MDILNRMQVIGHGIDLVDVERIEEMLERHGARFMERCFTVREQMYCESSAGSRAQRYAARFAAKEAVFKALGTGLVGGMAFSQIEVLRAPDGAPSLDLQGRVAEVAEEAGIVQWQLSLSHIQTHATASVLALGDPAPC